MSSLSARIAIEILSCPLGLAAALESGLGGIPYAPKVACPNNRPLPLNLPGHVDDVYAHMGPSRGDLCHLVAARAHSVACMCVSYPTVPHILRVSDTPLHPVIPLTHREVMNAAGTRHTPDPAKQKTDSLCGGGPSTSMPGNFLFFLAVEVRPMGLVFSRFITPLFSANQCCSWAVFCKTTGIVVTSGSTLHPRGQHTCLAIAK